MSSSSSDSEDENITLLRQAVDTNFISDGMFTSGTSSTGGTNSKEATSNHSHESLPKPLKSQRYIEYNEIESDLNVSKSMQDFVYKKMSQKIADSIEFVEISAKKSKKRKHVDNDTSCVRLLKDTDPITEIDSILEGDVKPAKGKKLNVTRRIIEPDSYDQEEKIKLTVVDGESILEQTETKYWNSKKLKPNKVFNYCEKNSVLHAVEPDNEFSALRRKYKWNESKIATFPWKKHYNN